MCSIEEAWAGQLFEGRKVASQADLRQHYMPSNNELLERNNEFVVSHNEPQPRDGTRGLNTKMSREPRVPNISRNSPMAQVNYSSTMPTGSTYSGVEPRPAYMSIYDNAEGNNMQMSSPMPSVSGKEKFNDINQAFTVSDTVSHFMNRMQGNNNNPNNNPLLNEDNETDRMILQQKLNSLNSLNSLNNETFTNNNNNNTNGNLEQIQKQHIQFQQVLQDVLQRLAILEKEMHHSSSSRNMYDMILYIIVGMLISFIIYSILRK